MTVRVDVNVKDVASGELSDLSHRAHAVRDMLDSMGSAMVASTQQRFLDEVSPDGGRWARHSDVTIARRGAGAEKLRSRGSLFDTIGHKVDSDERVLVGANRVYARIQQLGGQAGRGRKVTIPARPYLGVSSDDKQELRSIAAEHLRGDS